MEELLAKLGRFGDTELAHVTPGEIVVPVEAQNPELIRQIAEAIRSIGADISDYTVGGPRQNPVTGLPEFWSWSKFLGSVFGGALGGAASSALDIAPALGSAVGAGAGTLVAGGSPTEAILAGAGNYLGGELLGPELGFEGSVLGQNAGTLAGQALGGAAGVVLGEALQPPKVQPPKLDRRNINTNIPSLPGATPQTPTPDVAPKPSTGALSGGLTLTQPVPPGVSYLMSVTDRVTGKPYYIVSPFGNSLSYDDRRAGWGEVIYA